MFPLKHKWFTGKVVVVEGRTSDGCTIPLAAGVPEGVLGLLQC